MKPIIALESVCKYYTSASNIVMALNNVQLSFCRGEFVAITGESGSGKSTLSNVIGGILGYESGELFFDGKSTSHFDADDWERYRRDHISYVSQDYGILPGATVLTNVTSALRISGFDRRLAKTRAKEILEEMELWQLRGKRAGRLSSGQKQRLSIARALSKPTSVLIADEPTGNLDPENSEKVISLLAAAAKDRLVIVVTHEFDEVQNYATRHIRLQDGCVVLDTLLRAVNDVTPPRSMPVSTKKDMSLFVAGLQLSSRPIWSGFMTCLFALTAFAVVILAGTFLVALDDTDVRLYDSTAFINASPERIVVSRADLQPLTEADLDTFASVNHICYVEPNGYVADAQYAFQEGVDYTEKRTETIIDFGGIMHQVKITYIMHADAPFVRTVPVLPQDQTFLKEGSLPDGFYEVVAHVDSGLQIGDEVKVFLMNRRYWTDSAYLMLTFSVVGTTEFGSGLYFSEDLGRFYQHVAHASGSAKYYQFIPAKESVLNLDSVPEEALPEEFSTVLMDHECVAHSSVMVSQKDQEDEYESITLSVPDINLKMKGENPLSLKNQVLLSTPRKYTITYYDPVKDKDVTRKIQSYGSHGHATFTRLLFVNEKTFDALCWSAASEQASIQLDDYAYTQRVLDELIDMGYIAISPFRLGATVIDEEKAEKREQTLSICLIALLAVVVLQIVVLRTMCGVQISSYNVLRNIGLVRKSAKLSLLWQFLLFACLGQLIAGGVLVLCWEMQLERVVRIMRYLTPGYIAVLSLVHLAAVLAAAFWTVRAMEKQVYPVISRYEDLPLDEEDAL